MTTIELSLASPTFRELGPEARDLLGVIAFFPQGINESNIDWLFPSVSDRANAFDKFCVLSLTYRSNGFITMLAPLRDYLCPKDPMTSSLLCTTKERYFGRLLVNPSPNKPGFGETRWIISEDVNVEHLLDVFTTVDASSSDVWGRCGHFLMHLQWHKPRLVALGPKIEGLPDGHPLKPLCLMKLSHLFSSLGNYVERKRLLIHALKLWRERGDDLRAAQALRHLSDANRMLCLYEEGEQQAKEALEIYKQHNDTSRQGKALCHLARLWYGDKQFDAAEEVALQAIDLLSDTDDQYRVCECHHILGGIYCAKDEAEKAIDHFETALGIASSLSVWGGLFWIHYSLAELFSAQGKFDDAHARIELAKSHAINDPYSLGCAMELEARVWYQEGRFGDAKSEALRAADVYEKLGATMDLENCGALLRNIDETMMGELITAGESDFDSESLEPVPFPTLIDPPSSVQ